jgi:DNA-directed RNA polymerase subunit H
MNSDRVSKIYNSRNILLTQLACAGYSTVAYDHASIEEVNAMDINSQLDMLVMNENKTKLYVNYHIGEDRFSDRTLNSLCNTIFGDANDGPILSKDDILIIILMEDVTETVTTHLMRLYDRYGYFIIPRPIDQLQFNILEHKLVPRHTIVPNSDVPELLIRYHASLEHLPKLSRFDPVARAICIRPNQVCEIKRPSNSACSSLYYRVCINSEFKM